MPKNKGESKQGLIITLVFFVILSIGLGVTAYYGFDGQQAITDQKKEAEKKLASMTKSRDWENYKALLYKSYLGRAQAEELGTLAGLHGKHGKGEGDQPEVENLRKELDAELAATKSYKAEVARLKAELLKTETVLAKEKVDTAKAMAEMDQQRLANNAEKDSLKEQFAKAKQEADKALNDKLAAVEVRQEEIKKLQQETQNLKRSNDDNDKKLKGDLDSKEKIIKGQQTVLQKFRDKEKPESLLDYESPRGKIVSLDRSGRTAYINLGSADGVKPQLTFSIFRNGGGLKEGRERKGAVEVVRVLDSHMAMARISEVTDAAQHPVTPGDMVYNPAWNPSLRQRVAVVGLIDLDGDGNDDSVQFVRALEKQGIVVDGFLDLNDAEPKFRGKLDIQTNYLVLGDRPEFTSFTAGDSRTERLKKVSEIISDKQTEATKWGVTVVPARRFMALIGYQLPKNALAPNFRSRQSVTTQPSAAPAEKPAAEGKDEAMKDKDPADEPQPAKPAKAKNEDKPKEKPAAGKPKPPAKAKDKDGDKDDKDKDADKDDKDKDKPKKDEK